MRISICLYSQLNPGNMPQVIEKSMPVVDYTIPLQVSRTIGRANRYEIERQFQNDEDVVDLEPKMDIYRKDLTSSKEASSFFREDSALIVHYTYCRSDVLGHISREIASEFEHGFFHSDASFTFGPADIIRLAETNDGEIDVELLAISMVQFQISSDNFQGDPARLIEHLPKCPSFKFLHEGLNSILNTQMKLTVIF